MAPRKKCPICGSKQWRKDSVSGMVTCSEGHVLQYYRTESGDAEDLGAQTLKKRTIKSTRTKKERTSRADPKLYHGDRARFHYYQCLQLLLRKQIAALVTLWSLPPEFETICKDLWTLHLNLVPNPPPAEPFHYKQEMCDASFAPGASAPAAQERQFAPGNGCLPDIGVGSSSEGGRTDAELGALIQEYSEISSTDEEEGRPHLKHKGLIKPNDPLVARPDRLENTIAVLVLACWTIRLPVVYMDFINAIEAHSIPYLDHVRLLPTSLTRHLTKHAVQALSPHHPPKTWSLHRVVSRYANRLVSNFDVSIPELNAAPVLWRVVQQCFCCTPILYLVAKQLGHVLSLPISLHPSSSSTIRGSDVGNHRHNSVPPEVALVSTTIVALKLVYGLDGKTRLPRDSGDAACAFPAVDEFLAAVRRVNDTDPIVNNHQFSARIPMSVGDLDDAALDEYLNFCEKVLVGPRKNEQRLLDNYFPLRKENAGEGSVAVTADLSPRVFTSVGANGTSDVLQPGESYTIYHCGDVLGNLPPDLDILVQRASRWAGVSGDHICGVVERYERRLVRWWRAERQHEAVDVAES